MERPKFLQTNMFQIFLHIWIEYSILYHKSTDKSWNTNSLNDILLIHAADNDLNMFDQLWRIISSHWKFTFNWSFWWQNCQFTSIWSSNLSSRELLDLQRQCYLHIFNNNKHLESRIDKSLEECSIKDKRGTRRSFDKHWKKQIICQFWKWNLIIIPLLIICCRWVHYATN